MQVHIFVYREEDGLSTYTLRAMQESDLAAVDQVLLAAYGRTQSFIPRLKSQIALQSDGWLAVFDGDAVVGCGGITVMGAIGYIGLIATAPERQRQGIARYLMDNLLAIGQQHGCTTILLDASESGKPLYEGMGFISEDEVQFWKHGGALLPVPYNSSVKIFSYHPTHFAELADFDARGFGARRDRILAIHFADAPSLVCLARDAAGVLSGYMSIQETRHIIGPWLAATPAAAEALLSWGLARVPVTEAGIMAPGANHAAADLLARHGFVSVRKLTHMRYGEPLNAMRRQVVYGQINYSLG